MYPFVKQSTLFSISDLHFFPRTTVDEVFARSRDYLPSSALTLTLFLRLRIHNDSIVFFLGGLGGAGKSPTSGSSNAGLATPFLPSKFLLIFKCFIPLIFLSHETAVPRSSPAQGSFSIPKLPCAVRSRLASLPKSSALARIIGLWRAVHLSLTVPPLFRDAGPVTARQLTKHSSSPFFPFFHLGRPGLTMTGSGVPRGRRS